MPTSFENCPKACEDNLAEFSPNRSLLGSDIGTFLERELNEVDVTESRRL